MANDSFITLLDTYVDIMSDAGRIVTNCENCGQLMITNRANASPAVVKCCTTAYLLVLSSLDYIFNLGYNEINPKDKQHTVIII